MPQPITAPETITLKSGFVVSIEALNIAWDLEQRGFLLSLADDGGLLVRPKREISPSDDEAIRTHRNELIILVRCSEAIQ